MIAEDFKNIAALFEHPEEVSFESFCKYVDDSPYSANEWVESLQVVHLYLKSEMKKLDLKLACGYLACVCEEAASTPYFPQMSDLVQEMISEHGIERAYKS